MKTPPNDLQENVTWAACTNKRPNSMGISYRSLIDRVHAEEYGFYCKPPFVVLDFDTRETNALRIIRDFRTFTDITPNGYHVICKGYWNGDKKVIQLDEGELRVKTSGYVVWYGNPSQKWPVIHNRQEVMDSLAGEYFTQVRKTVQQTFTATEDAVLQMVMADERFRKLYETGDWYVWFPSQSEADYFFCKVVSDCYGTQAMADDLMQSSALMRSKWNRGDYKERTLDAAFRS